MRREGKPKSQSEKCEVTGVLQTPRRLLSHKPFNCRAGLQFLAICCQKRESVFPPKRDLYNMVTGKELATGHVDQMMPLTVDSNIMRIAGHQVGLPLRIIAKLCDVIESQVPIGYEDEGGFHYGANPADEFFSI